MNTWPQTSSPLAVLDPDAETAHVFRADAPPGVLGRDDQLELPGVLDGLHARVGTFFESSARAGVAARER